MFRLVLLAAALSLVIGCSKSKPKATEQEKQAGVPKSTPKSGPTPGPGTIPIPKIERPESLPSEMLAEIRALVKPLKGEASYDASSLSINFSSTKIQPGTLEKLKPYAKYLQHLGIINCEITDAELQSMPEFPWLRTLTLHQLKGTTDAMFTKLAPLKRLVSLSLMNTPITDAGLTGLTAFPALTELQLWGTATSDAGLKHIAKLPNLIALRLNRTKVTGTGLADLAPLTKLNTIDLTETSVTDAGLASMPSMPSLRGIYLNQTAIGDEGMSALVLKAPNLSTLDLLKTRITDASAKSITMLNDLRSLTITGTQMTKAGVDMIKAKFSKVSVYGP